MEAYRNFFPAIVFGLLTIFSLAVVFSLLAATTLAMTELTEDSIGTITKVVAFITILIGGITAGAKSKAKGLLVGAITTMIFTIIAFTAQFLGYDHTFTIEQYLYHGGYILCGAFGGMIGVNLFSGDS